MGFTLQSACCKILCSLAEFKQKFFKDEDGSSGAEDDEGLTAEEAEDSASQSCAQEALHHTL